MVAMASRADAICERGAGRKAKSLALGERGRFVSRVDREIEIWRRITGMTHAFEAFMDACERRAGIGRLAKWITTKLTAETQRRGEEKEGETGGRKHGTVLGFLEDREVEEWGCWETREFTVDCICAEVGISKVRLTGLFREYCGLTAAEFLDGLKLKGFKGSIVERVRAAAQSIWGRPGAIAEGMVSSGSRAVGAAKSKYFRSFCKAVELGIKEEVYEREARRLGELLTALKDRESECGVDFEAWAHELGYSSAARFKRACLNVYKKTPRQLLKMLAKEVVDYYLCAEEKVLREIAMRQSQSVMTLRAREYYFGYECTLMPQAPFNDRWSYAEETRGGWLGEMGKVMG